MNKGQLRTHFLNLLNRTDCSNALADTFLDQSISRAPYAAPYPTNGKDCYVYDLYVYISYYNPQ